MNIPLNTWNIKAIPSEEFPRWRHGNVDTAAVASLWRNLSGFKTVLEVGCLMGGDAIAFTRQGFEVTAIDIDAFALTLARKYALEAGAHINFMECNIQNIDFKDNSIDCVHAVNVLSLTYTQGLYQAMGQIHRVMRMGGELAADLLSKDSVDFSRGIMRVDANTVLHKAQYGDHIVPYCFVDESMLPGLFRGFEILGQTKNPVRNVGENVRFTILARKVAAR